MTKRQREILKGYLDNESSFPIHTIEYPSGVEGHGNDNLKVVTSSLRDCDTKYVDYFAPNGRTVETRRFTESSVREYRIA